VADRYLIVISEPDPVASRVVQEWGTPPATGDRVDGTPLRRLNDTTLELRRAGRHIHDERLDLRLPREVRDLRPTLVFPSIHRSEQNVVCLTVHPLGNLGGRSELGGRPRTVSPTDPRSMASVLRNLSERGASAGFTATYEATHHGPELGLPACFVEIGYGTANEPPAAAVRVLAATLREIAPDPADRIAFGVGGGHYAPHFTDLALRRRWALGHIVSRHALEDLDTTTAAAAYRSTPGAEGILFARAQDASHPSLVGLGRRLRDSDAPSRGGPRSETEASTRGVRPSGT
jgi:D-aminoacyl-tRNA deacylase